MLCRYIRYAINFVCFFFRKLSFLLFTKNSLESCLFQSTVPKKFLQNFLFSLFLFLLARMAWTIELCTLARIKKLLLINWFCYSQFGRLCSWDCLCMDGSSITWLKNSKIPWRDLRDTRNMDFQHRSGICFYLFEYFP